VPYEPFPRQPDHFSGYEAEQMMPEVNESIKTVYSKLELPAALGCGDDRAITQESIDRLVKRGKPLDKPFIRLFGGKHGAANILAVTTIAQYGPDYMKQKLGSNIHHLADEVSGRSADRGVFMLNHSSDGAEGNAAAMTHDASSPLGCARIAAMGQVNHLSASDQLAIRVAEADSEAIFGNAGHSSESQKIPGSFAAASGIYFGEHPETFSVSRQDIEGSDLMILSKSHAKTEDTVHVVNLKPDMVSDVNEAIVRGLHFYDSDVTIAAELLLRCFPELRLDPLIMMKVMIADQVSTRMALAAADGPADPQRLPSHRFGDGREALEYLSAVS
jgi:hypothetical protein